MRFILCCFFLAATLYSCSNSKLYEITKEDSGTKIVTGKFERALFHSDADLKSWFEFNYAGYEVDHAQIPEIKTRAQNVRYMIILGTWCSDSKKQIPRLLKIFDAANIDSSSIELHGVDRLKQSEEGISKKYSVEKVPTIIVLKEGKEIGRIVEEPHETLEKDLIQILKIQ